MPLVNRQRALDVMNEAGVDVLIGTSADNVRYLTDYDCISHRITPSIRVFGILPRDPDGEVGLVVPSLEVDAWAEQPRGVADVTPYGTLYRDRLGDKGLAEDDARIYELTMATETWSSALEGLRSALQRRRLMSATIGIDESGLDVSAWQALVSHFPDAKIVPAGALFRTIRMVKTREEISRIEKAANITVDAIRAVYDLASAGVTEQELANHFKAEVARLGATPQFWVICGGRRTAHTHPRPSDYVLSQNDILKLDVGCTYEGYWSDIGRTKVLGEPTHQQEAIHSALLTGLKAAIHAVKPGVRTSEVFDAAVNAVRESGIPSYRRHHCGHGIGMSVYDSPVVQSSHFPGIYGFGDEDPVLETGMVINLETPYYLLGDYGFIVEDTVVVEQGGARTITNLSHEFRQRAGSKGQPSIQGTRSGA